MKDTQRTKYVPPMSYAEFMALPEADRRKRIARDVKAQLAAEKLVACPGAFVTLDAEPEWVDDSEAELVLLEYAERGYAPTLTDPRDIELSLSEAQHCFVCGVGSLFVSTALLVDNVGDRFERLDADTLGGIHAGQHMADYLGELFSYGQLALIEAAFEEGNGVLPYHRDLLWPDEEFEAAVAFGARYGTPDERLEAIMDRILAHPEGLFVP